MDPCDQRGSLCPTYSTSSRGQHRESLEFEQRAENLRFFRHPPRPRDLFSTPLFHFRSNRRQTKEKGASAILADAPGHHQPALRHLQTDRSVLNRREA